MKRAHRDVVPQLHADPYRAMTRTPTAVLPRLFAEDQVPPPGTILGLPLELQPTQRTRSGYTTWAVSPDAATTIMRMPELSDTTRDALVRIAEAADVDPSLLLPAGAEVPDDAVPYRRSFGPGRVRDVCGEVIATPYGGRRCMLPPHPTSSTCLPVPPTRGNVAR